MMWGNWAQDWDDHKKCGRVKQVNGIQTLPLLINGYHDAFDCFNLLKSDLISLSQKVPIPPPRFKNVTITY